jgi:hypothetical protein
MCCLSLHTQKSTAQPRAPSRNTTIGIPCEGNFAIPGAPPVLGHKPCTPEEVVQRVELRGTGEEGLDAGAKFVATTGKNLESSPAQKPRELIGRVDEGQGRNEILLRRSLQENEQALFLAFQVACRAEVALLRKLWEGHDRFCCVVVGAHLPWSQEIIQ